MGNYDDMEKLADRFMLISVIGTCPSGKVNDKELAEEIRVAYGAADSEVVDTILKVYNTPALKETQKIVAKARNEIKYVSRPWSDTGRGPRLIESSKVDAAEDLVMEHEALGSEQYKKFLDEYEDLKAKKKISMGKLFKEEHWPTREDLKSKFKLKCVVDTVPDPEQDVRAGWTEEQKKKHRERIIESERLLSEMAMESVARDAHKKVAKLAERLRKYTGKREGSFKESTLKNVEDMADILESFNLTNNQDVSNIVKRIRQEVVNVSADVLRVDDARRDEVAKSAEKTAVDLAARMGGFGTN